MLHLVICAPFQGCGPCQLLLRHAAYRRMLVFLLGPNRQNNQVNLPRRQNRRVSNQSEVFVSFISTAELLWLHKHIWYTVPHHNVEHESTSHKTKTAREQIRWKEIPDKTPY